MMPPHPGKKNLPGVHARQQLTNNNGNRKVSLAIPQTDSFQCNFGKPLLYLLGCIVHSNSHDNYYKFLSNFMLFSWNSIRPRVPNFGPELYFFRPALRSESESERNSLNSIL